MTILQLPPTAPPSAGRREWAALSVLVLAVVLLAVDGTVLALAVPALTTALDPTAGQMLWIADVYTFALAGLLIVMGGLADRYGRKRVLLLGAAAFGVSSALAAFATDPVMLMAARAAQGVAAATLMPSTLSLIRNLFADPRQRTQAIALWSAGASGGAVAGPLVGGLLLEHYWWGSVFLINVPVMAVLLVAGWLLLPESRDPSPGRLDVAGAALSVVAVLAFVFAVKDLLAAGPTGRALVATALSGLAGWLFVRRQRRVDDPLVDVELFRNRAFSGALACQLISLVALMGLLFFFSQYLQLVRGHTALMAGVLELPLTVAAMAVVLLVGPVAVRLGQGRAIGAGLGLAAAGLLALALAESSEGYAGLAVALLMTGAGFGLAITLCVDTAVSAVDPHRAGTASALSETSYELGAALGIALMGSLQLLLYRLRLTDDVAGLGAGAVRESLARGIDVLSVRGSEAELALARHAFTWGLQLTAVVSAVLLLLAAAIAWRVIPSTRSYRPHA